MKTLPAKLSIGRYSGSREGIHIDVIDESSRVTIVELDVSFEEFAKALTGMYGVPCVAEWRGTELIGKQHQHKTEEVPFRYPFMGKGKAEKAAKEAIKPFEVGGWRGDWTDCLNWHRRVRDGVQQVSFTRYVDAEEQA